MTPKEKAIELVNKFKPYMDGWRKANYVHFAKQCALIAVKEIINLGLLITDSNELFVSCDESQCLSYWLQVKTEIENI